jgi:hypothetical protein
MSHQPKRGDEVEAWLKRQRDMYAESREYDERAYWAYVVLDDALDEYRLRSDTGASLETPREKLGSAR